MSPIRRPRTPRQSAVSVRYRARPPRSSFLEPRHDSHVRRTHVPDGSCTRCSPVGSPVSLAQAGQATSAISGDVGASQRNRSEEDTGAWCATRNEAALCDTGENEIFSRGSERGARPAGQRHQNASAVGYVGCTQARQRVRLLPSDASSRPEHERRWRSDTRGCAQADAHAAGDMAVLRDAVAMGRGSHRRPSAWRLWGDLRAGLIFQQRMWRPM